MTTMTVRLASLGVLLCLLTFSSSPAQAEEGSAYHFAIAKLAAADGDFDNALASFEQAVALEPDDATLRIEFAEFLARSRRLAEAAEQARKAVELSPRDAYILSLYGQIEQARARDDESAVERAIGALETLREIDPADIQGMVTLGQLYQGRGRVDEAVEIYEELVRYNTDNGQLKRLLVETLQRAGQTERAREVLEEIISLEQESLESRITLAELETEKGNHDAAIEILESSGERLLQDPRVAGLLAEAYMRRASSPGLRKAQRDEDLERASEVLASVPVEARGIGLYRLEAQVLRRQGRVDEALEIARTIKQRLPEEVWSHLFLAGLLETSGAVEEAAEVLADAATSFADQQEMVQELWRQRAWLEVRRENWDEVARWSGKLYQELDGESRGPALALHLEALMQNDDGRAALRVVRNEQKRSPEESSLLVDEARVLSHLGRKKESLKVLRPVADSLGSEELGLAFRVAELLDELDQSESAGRLIERLTADGQFAALFAAGRFYSGPGTFEEAIPYLERALEVSPGDEVGADVNFWLGQAHERIGETDQAAVYFREVLRIRPDDSTAMNYLGYMWAEVGINLEEALRLIRRAVEIEPDNGSYVDSLGWAQFKLGRFEEARENLERASSLTPDNATILEHLGDVYMELGEPELAESAYERAVELEDDENLEKVRQKLLEVRRPRPTGN